MQQSQTHGSIWRFPETGVPPVIIHFDGVSRKQSIWGITHVIHGHCMETCTFTYDIDSFHVNITSTLILIGFFPYKQTILGIPHDGNPRTSQSATSLDAKSLLPGDLLVLHHPSGSSAVPAAPEASLEPSRPGDGDFMLS